MDVISPAARSMVMDMLDKKDFLVGEKRREVWTVVDVVVMAETGSVPSPGGRARLSVPSCKGNLSRQPCGDIQRKLPGLVTGPIFIFWMDEELECNKAGSI